MTSKKPPAEQVSRVTLAYPYTDQNGVMHDADSTVDLPPAEAANLLVEGRARAAEKE